MVLVRSNLMKCYFGVEIRQTLNKNSNKENKKFIEVSKIYVHLCLILLQVLLQLILNFDSRPKLRLCLNESFIRNEIDANPQYSCNFYLSNFIRNKHIFLYNMKFVMSLFHNYCLSYKTIYRHHNYRDELCVANTCSLGLEGPWFIERVLSFIW